MQLETFLNENSFECVWNTNKLQKRQEKYGQNQFNQNKSPKKISNYSQPYRMINESKKILHKRLVQQAKVKTDNASKVVAGMPYATFSKKLKTKRFRNFIKAHKRTDVCNHCLSKEKHKHNVESKLKPLLIQHGQKIDTTSSFEDIDFETLVFKDRHMDADDKLYWNNILNRIKFYEKHKEYASQQTRELEKRINKAKKDSSKLVMIFDFKEYFQLGGGPVESSRVFYTKVKCSIFGAAIINGSINGGRPLYVIIVSNLLDHNGSIARKQTKMVIESLFDASPGLLNQVKDISTFVDSGTHFVSYTFAYLALHWNCISFKANTHLGILGAHHGKTMLDGIFGVLGSKVTEAEKSTQINSIVKLVDIINGIDENIDSDVIAIPWIVDLDANKRKLGLIDKMSPFGIQSSMGFTCYSDEIIPLHNSYGKNITYRVQQNGLSSNRGGKYVNYKVQTTTQRHESEKQLPRVQVQVTQVSKLL